MDKEKWTMHGPDMIWNTFFSSLHMMKILWVKQGRAGDPLVGTFNSIHMQKPVWRPLYKLLQWTWLATAITAKKSSGTRRTTKIIPIMRSTITRQRRHQWLRQEENSCLQPGHRQLWQQWQQGQQKINDNKHNNHNRDNSNSNHNKGNKHINKDKHNKHNNDSNDLYKNDDDDKAY